LRCRMVNKSPFQETRKIFSWSTWQGSGDKTPKPPEGGLSVIVDCGLWIADLKNFLKKILNMESSAYGI